MTTDEIRTLVFRALGRVAPEADVGTLDASVPFRDQLDLDSMDFLNFVIGLHDGSGVDVPEADYAELATLDGCVAYLERKLRTGKATT